MQKLLGVFNQSRSFLSDMQNVYRISWKNNLKSCTGKLRTYSTYKHTFSLENYIIQFPLAFRRNLTKLRISAHNLAIETGRYTKGTNIMPNKRLCFHCKLVESEYHLVLECSLYTDLRKNFFERLNQISTIASDPSDDTFSLLMSCLNEDVEVVKLFCEYINNCFDKRRETYNTIRQDEIFKRPLSTLTRSGRISKRPTRIDI